MARMQVIEGCHSRLLVTGGCSLLIVGIGKSGVTCQVSEAMSVSAETQSLKPDIWKFG